MKTVTTIIKDGKVTINGKPARKSFLRELKKSGNYQASRMAYALENGEYLKSEKVFTFDNDFNKYWMV